MLSWNAGARPDDGVWGKHWYGAVNRSTGFAAPKHEYLENNDGMAALVAQALPYYERMAGVALRV